MPVPQSPPTDACLAPTPLIDRDHPAQQAFAGEDFTAEVQRATP